MRSILLFLFLWSFHADHGHAVAGGLGNSLFNSHSLVVDAAPEPWERYSESFGQFLYSDNFSSEFYLPRFPHVPQLSSVGDENYIILRVIPIDLFPLYLQPNFKRFEKINFERFKGFIPLVECDSSSSVVFEILPAFVCAPRFHSPPTFPKRFHFRRGGVFSETVSGISGRYHFIPDASASEDTATKIPFRNASRVSAQTVAEQHATLTCFNCESSSRATDPLFIYMDGRSACANIPPQVRPMNFLFFSALTSDNPVITTSNAFLNHGQLSKNIS